MPREIKTTLALDGEAKFKAGIKAIDQELRVMGSELGAVTSGYDKNNASMKDLKAKGDVFAKQIEQQKIKQEALNGAVKDAAAAFDKAAAEAKAAAEKYGENSKEAQKAADAVSLAEKKLNDYKIQANSATKSLNQMQSAQDANVKAIKEMQNAKFSKIADGFKNIASAAGQTASGIASVAAKAFAGYATAATGAGTALFGLSSKAGAAADDINTMSKVTGLSTAEIQKLQYASELIDVDVDTVTKSMAKLTKNMSSAKGGSKETSEAFAQLGVSVTDSNGQLRSNQDVFAESIKALGTVENATERDALAMKLFGKSAQELNPLILGGADQLKNLGDQADAAGLIMSQNALDNMNSFNDSLDILKSNAAASGNIIGGTFAGKFKAFTDIIGGAIPGISTSFAQLFNGGDMTANTAAFTEKLTTFGKVILTKIAESLPQMLAGFNGVIIGIVTAITNTLPQTMTTILPALITGFDGLVSGLVAQIPVLLPALIDGGITLFLGLLNSLESVINQLMPMLPDLITKICDTLINNLPAIIDAGFNILIGLITGIVNAIPTLIVKVIELIPVIIKSLLDNLPKIIEAGIQIITALATGLPQAIPAVVKALPEIIGAIIDTILNTNWLDIGVQILKGIAAGLIEGVKAIADTIKNVAQSVVDGFKNFFGIHSPSRVFRDEVGKYLAQGVGVGFTDEMLNVAADMRNAVPTNFDIVTRSNAAVRSTAPGTANGGGNFYQTNYVARALTQHERYLLRRSGGQLAANGGVGY